MLSGPATRFLFRSYQRAGGGDALSGAVELDPGVHETFAVHVGLPFFGAFYAERSDHDCGIPIDLHVALLGDSLGRLIVTRLNTAQQFALAVNAAVNIDGYKGFGKDHVQSLRVFR